MIRGRALPKIPLPYRLGVRLGLLAALVPLAGHAQPTPQTSSPPRVEVIADLESGPWITSGSISNFRSQIETMAKSLQDPSDPPLQIILENEFNETRVEKVIEPDRATLRIPVGLFAFTRNLSELAGALSYEIAQLKREYEKRLDYFFQDRQIQTHLSRKEYLVSELTGAKLAAKNPHERRVFQTMLIIAEQTEKYAARRADKRLQEAIALSGMKIDLSDTAKQRVQASVDSIDRLIRGGYDPWGVLEPLKAIVRTEDLRGFIDRWKGGETVNLETEVIRNYLLYTESKKVDLTRQPHRGKPLSPDQAKIQQKSLALQTLKLGPEARAILGWTGAAALGGTLLKLGWQELPEQIALWKSDAEDDPISREELRKTIEKGANQELSPEMKNLWGAAGTAMGWGITASMLKAITTVFSAPFNIRSQSFTKRLLDNLKLQGEAAAKLHSLQKQKPPSIEALSEATELQSSLAQFIRESLAQDFDKISARELYRILFGRNWASAIFLDGVMPQNPEILQAKQHYLAKAKEILGQQDPSSKNADNPKEIEKLAKKLARTELFWNAVFPPEIASDKISKTGIGLNLDGAEAFQKFLFFRFGALNQALSSKNTEELAKLIAKRAEDPKLTSDERAKLSLSLARLQGLEFFNEAAKKAYVQAFQKLLSLPDETLQSPEALSRAYQDKKLPRDSYRPALALLAKKDLSGLQLAEVFSTLVREELYTDAALLLRRRLKEIGSSLYRPGNNSLKQEFHRALESLFSHWRGVHIPLWKKTLLRSELFARSLALSDKTARAALGTRLLDQAARGFIPMKNEASALYRWIVFRHLQDSHQISDLSRAYEELKQSGAENQNLAGSFLKRLNHEPALIQTTSDLQEILAQDAFWAKFVSTAKNAASFNDKSEWEEKILKKYESYAQKYPSFQYNPNHSEALQKLLTQAYERLTPNPTLEDRASFWRGLASRGPTGVSDALFEKILSEAQGPKFAELRERISIAALENGLLWDGRLRGEVYKIVHAKEISPQRLADGPAAGKARIKAALSTSSALNSDQVQTALREFQNSFPLDPHKDKPLIDEFRRLAHRSMSQAPSATQVDAFFNRHWKTLEPAGRLGALDQEVSKIHEAFPETGQSYIELLNWLSEKTQTKQSEAMHLKDRILKTDTSNSDLGISLVNSILNSALNWDKAEQWQLIRWLRGSGPPPVKITERFQRVGTDTVRRLFATLPIAARADFINALLNSPRSGLLSGISKKLYHEQILGEILPRDKESSEVALEILEPLLRAMERSSHKDKGTYVFAFLLAQPSDSSSVGVVLRQALESYGIVGVKLAQALAANDVLPEAIRKELAKARDQAKIPYRHESYERLSSVLKRPNLDPVLEILETVGGASVKYTLRARDPADPTHKDHAIQVQREEATVEVGRNFEELDSIIGDLIKKNPSRYSFLRGLVESVKDAIWREVSFPREDKKTNQAIEQYSKLNLGEGVTLQIPKGSDLIQKLDGPNSRFFFLRSSDFVHGKTIDQFEPEMQKKLARIVLRGEEQLLFPSEQTPSGASASREFDPDRQPGNVLFDVQPETKGVNYQPIDWGQLLNLTQAQRERIIRLMSYSQIFEQIGPIDDLFQKMVEELSIPQNHRTSLKRSLQSFFPNTSGAPRTGLAPYYFLLSELETAGFERNIVHYDFVRAIYALEPYETLLSKESSKNRPSPKARLAERTTQEVQKLTQNLSVSKKEQIRTALLHPKAALTASRNARLVQEGRLSQDQWLASFGLSNKAREAILPTLPKSSENAAEFHRALLSAIENPKAPIPGADRALLRRWQSSAQAGRLPLHDLSTEDYQRITANPSITQSLKPSEEGKKRAPLPQPRKKTIPASVGNVYAAEFVNAVFWGLVDQDPNLANQWLHEVKGWDKHAGFASFAAASGTYSSITNKIIPMSKRALRYFNQGGVSLAIGMIASDATRRLMQGQSIEEVIQHVKSKENLKELGFSTLTFMASTTAVDTTLKAAADRKWIPCEFRFKNFVKTSATFIGASAIDRGLRKPLTERGLLDQDSLHKFREVSKKYYERIHAKMAKLDELYEKGQGFEALQYYSQISDESMASYLGAAAPAFWEKSKAGSDARQALYSHVLEITKLGIWKSAFTQDFDQYKVELQKLIADSSDSFFIAAIEAETDAIQELGAQLRYRYWKGIDGEPLPSSYLEVPERYRSFKIPEPSLSPSPIPSPATPVDPSGNSVHGGLGDWGL